MDRMKESYEVRARHYLTRRIPVVMRLDGKAFHTYTKGLNKPFDEGLIEDMQKTAIYLCENIQGAKCAYVQSDEISLLLTDYDKIDTQAWFDYEVQKMVSISASFATAKFNELRLHRFIIESNNALSDGECLDKIVFESIKLANFDSRVFSIPKDDVANYFLARQLDAEKNSVAMLAQSLYSHKELHGKHGGEMQEMCFQKGHNWNDLHFSKKRGSFIVKNTYCNGNMVRNQFNNSNILESEGKYYDVSKVSTSLIYLPCETPIEKPIIRTKWEVVETPMRFNHSHFETWNT